MPVTETQQFPKSYRSRKATSSPPNYAMLHNQDVCRTQLAAMTTGSGASRQRHAVCDPMAPPPVRVGVAVRLFRAAPLPRCLRLPHRSQVDPPEGRLAALRHRSPVIHRTGGERQPLRRSVVNTPRRIHGTCRTLRPLPTRRRPDIDRKRAEHEERRPDNAHQEKA